MTPRTLTRTFLVAALAALAALALPALAAARDRNHDRIPDRWEKRHHLSLHVKQTRGDQDHDHLRNRAEFLAGDNPRDRDSDDDGVMDGEENAGTIASFDSESGRLKIDLFNGNSISGLVDDQTEIKCEGTGSAATTSHEDSSGPGPGEESGEEEAGGERGEEEATDERGEEEAGDADNSGPGSEHSDDGDRDQHACSSEQLIAGAVVGEAELELEHGQAVFDEVELAD